MFSLESTKPDFQDVLNNLLIICYSSWVYFFIKTSKLLIHPHLFNEDEE